MRLRAPATRVPMRLEPLVAVWELPLTGRPCISQPPPPPNSRSGKEVIGVPHLSACGRELCGSAHVCVDEAGGA
jgi:hypothetical protein